MKKLLMGHQIGKDLCDALGLPKNTLGFTLRCYPSEVVTVTCEYAPDDESIVRHLGNFELVQRDPAPDAAAPFHYDTWLRERTERAHAEYMERTSRYLPCDWNADLVARYMGAPV